MNDSYSDAIKEAFAVAPATNVTLHTLEIRQDGVQSPIYLVQSHRALMAKDENGVFQTFGPSGFQFSMPPSTGDGFTSLNIAITNIGRRASDFIDIAKTAPIPVQVIYRPYLSDDLSKPQMIPPLVLYLKDAQINVIQVLGQATFMDLVNKKFPSELYTRERFPALG